ncbi:MAG: ABC transporter substrate-binding protein [Thermoleophilia bacterium]
MKLSRVCVKFALMAAAIAVIPIGLAACGDSTSPSTSSSTEAGSYKIGAVLSLTGTYAALGEAEKNAIELEVARINDAGGINGRQLEVIIEDDATDEAKAVAAAAKLIEQEEVVALIGASGTGQTMAMRGDVDRAGLAQISLAGGTVVTSEFDSFVFQTPWSNTIVVPFVLDAMKTAGHSKIAVISDTGGYGKDGLAVIEADVADFDMTIVANETFNPGDSDVTAQLTKIKKSGADAVLLWTAGKEGAITLKNAADLGLEAPFFGGSGQARTEFIEGAGDAAEGFVFGTGKSLVPANWGEDSEQFAVVTDFATRYTEKYGEAPDIFAGHAFDAMTLLSDALTRAGADADAAAIRDALEATDGVVGFGGTFTFSATDHNGLTADDLALYEITNGAWAAAK